MKSIATKLRSGAGRWWRRRFSSTGMILLYHRVATLPADPYLLAVSPAHFAEHLAVLRRDYYPMPLTQFVAAGRAGRLPCNAVAITFDDGYADNLLEAAPLLKQFDVPATMFVVTKPLTAGQEFWWDELERLLLQPGTLPAKLRLQLNGCWHEWEFGAQAHITEAEWQQHRHWNYGRQDDPTLRHSVFRQLWSLLQSAAEPERDAAMRALREWATAPTAARPTHRPLTPNEIANLADDALLELGAHTVSHPRLAPLPVTTQRRQIEQSKTILEMLLGKPVNGFSYPHGLRDDYTATTVALTREAGFAYACAAFRGDVKRTTDPFQLPRNNINDCDGERFASHLRELSTP